MTMKVFKELQGTTTTKTAIKGLKYIHLTREFMEVVVCTDVFVPVSPDLSLQLGIFAMLQNKMNGTVNIIYLTSTKSKRVYKPVLAAELFALVDVHDIGYTIAYTLC